MRKAFNFYYSYYEVVNELPEKDRLPYLMAILQRQFEGIEPTELKGMAKFAYISQKFNIDTQVAGYETKTKTKLTPVQGGTVGGTVGGAQGASVQEKGEGKEKGKEKGEQAEFSFKKSLLELVKNKNLVDDWLLVRKNKKASNTETALKGFLLEVEKSSKTLEDVLNECVTNSWAGFKSEWLKNKNYVTNGTTKGNSNFDDRLAKLGASFISSE